MPAVHTEKRCQLPIFTPAIGHHAPHFTGPAVPQDAGLEILVSIRVSCGAGLLLLLPASSNWTELLSRRGAEAISYFYLEQPLASYSSLPFPSTPRIKKQVV